MNKPADGSKCPYCGGIITTDEITRSNGTKHNEIHCKMCKSIFGYSKLEVGLIMPFGKHKGKSIEDLYSDHNGRQYLEWFITQDCKFATRVKEYLDNY